MISKNSRIKYLLTYMAQAYFCLFIFKYLSEFYFKYAPLKEIHYFNPTLFVQFLTFENFPISILFYCLLFLSISVVVLKNKNFGWEGLTNEKFSKFVIVGVTAIIAWSFSTYDYNLYYNQAHALDRILLILLGLLVYYHPIFIPLFTLESIAIVAQFHYPLGILSWTDKIPLFWFLIFSHLLFIKLIYKKFDSTLLLVVGISTFLSSYFYSGLGKLALGWVSVNKTHFLIINSYMNHWLTPLSEEALLNVVNIAKLLSPVIIVGTIGVELLALFVFFKRRYAILILGAFVISHLIIFCLSGIFFWKWIIINILLIVIFRKKETEPYFSRYNLICSICVILSTPLIFRGAYYTPSIWLAWFDTRIGHIFDLEAIGESGKRYSVARKFMSPYDLIFSQNRFAYLYDGTSLTGTYGTTLNKNLLIKINKLNSVDEVKELEKVINSNKLNSNSTERFNSFIKNYFGNLNRRGKKKIWINYFKAPHHIWNFSGDNNYHYQEKIKEIQVRSKKSLFDDEKIKIYENKIIQSISIDL